MMSIHMTSPQQWIIAIIIIIIMTQYMKTTPMTKNMAQPMNMDITSVQPMNTSPTIPPHPILTILHKIKNYR